MQIGSASALLLALCPGMGHEGRKSRAAEPDMARVITQILSTVICVDGHWPHFSNGLLVNTGQLMQFYVGCRQCLRWAWLQRVILVFTETALSGASRNRCSGGCSQGLR